MNSISSETTTTSEKKKSHQKRRVGVNLRVSEEERPNWEATIWEATRLQEAEHQSNTLPSSTQPRSQPTSEPKNTRSQITDHLKESGQDWTHEHSNDCGAQQPAIGVQRTVSARRAKQELQQHRHRSNTRRAVDLVRTRILGRKANPTVRSASDRAGHTSRQRRSRRRGVNTAPPTALLHHAANSPVHHR